MFSYIYLFSQDIAISMVFAVIFFCLAIATAVYAKDFDDLTQLSSIVDNIRDELGIASVSFLTFYINRVCVCVCVCVCVYVCELGV